jgi:hypothetical protein
VVKISVQLSITPCITQEVNEWSRSCDVILKSFSSLIMLQEQKNQRLIRIFNEYDSYKNAIEESVQRLKIPFTSVFLTIRLLRLS